MIEQLLYLLRYEYVTRIKKKDAYDESGVEKLTEAGLYEQIRNALEGQLPFCIGKIGGSEGFALSSMHFNRKKREAYEQLCRWSGFFPNEYDEAAFENYCLEQISAIGQLDIIIHYPKRYELLFLQKFAGDSLKWSLRITPWLQEKPWTKLLEGRRVLVVHPFANSIEKQYSRREKLFSNPDILPEFELHTLKAVQTIGNNPDSRFATWQEALDYMTDQISRISFDIALIGCGAYGLPLAARVKRMGKIGMHCGGELQTYFGIRGKRWDDMFSEKMLRVCNEYWIRPEESEGIVDAKSIEGGCYW